MKKIVILLALIFLNAQVASAIQETTNSQDEFMGATPSFESMNKQLRQNYFVPAKTEEELEKEQKEEQDKNERKMVVEELFDKGFYHSKGNSIKPIQLLRLKIKKASLERKANKEIKKQNKKIKIEGTSETAKAVEEVNEVEQEEAQEVNKLLLECKEMEYLTDKKELRARGGAKLIFPAQNISATSDEMVYDQVKNLVKMNGNVIIYKGEDEIAGDFMQIDLNEEIGILDNMKSAGYEIETVAERGIVMNDRTIQEHGHLTVAQEYKIQLRSGVDQNFGERWREHDRYTYEDLFHNSKFVIKSNHIILDSKGDIDKITLKRMELYKNGKRIFKFPSMTMYQNKTQDYFDGSYPELGSKPKLGMYIGPGWVVELPKNKLLKVAPMLNYNSGFGIGAYGRFRSATNTTEAAYGTANDFWMVSGRQELDKNLYLNYGANAYILNGWLGQGWARYMADLNYEKRTAISNFMGKKRNLNFEQMLSAGYIQNDGQKETYSTFNKSFFDKDHNQITNSNVGTMRFRYMLNTYQILQHYENPEKMFFADLFLYAQGSAAVYGTGDTQFIGRLGPMLRTQMKYWNQDIGFYASAYSDDSPLTYFDAYRYGKFNLYLREAIKLHRLLKISWYGSANLSDDAPDKRILQESKFIFNIGPDDMNLALGWDAIRQASYIGVNIDMDAKSTEVYYDKLEIKNQNNLGTKDPHGLANLEKEDERMKYNVYLQADDLTTNKKNYLEKCQIINIEDSSLRMQGEKDYPEFRKYPTQDTTEDL